MPMKRPLEDWEELQRKIFTRWVNQKLHSRHFPVIKDVLTDLGQGDTLSNLITALSDKEMPKPAKPPQLKVRAQIVEHLGKQMAWCYDCGVTMKIKPSQDNIYEGDFLDCMGLVYAIMQKFLKFDDDDGESTGTAQEALLRWTQFNTKGKVNVTNLNKSWHDGLALCALVSKFNEKAIDFDSLSGSNSERNIQMAMDAAEKYFLVEKFLTPAEVKKLDEKSMLVFLSEYYYGINDYFKSQLAGKRISKLIGFTRENDEARTKYAADGATMTARLSKAEGYLQNVAVVHNTMAGAKQNLADFNTYKSTEKRQIIALQLEMLGTINTLNLRLANNKRPDFQPASEIAPPTIDARIKSLQAKEEVEPKLHAELDRQKRLVETNTQHEARAAKIDRFIATKKAYLHEPLTVTNTGDARRLLKQYEGFQKELGTVSTANFPELQKIGQYLATEKYEFHDKVAAREQAIASGFDELRAKGAENEPVLQDSLDREVYREGIMTKVDVHADINGKLAHWTADKAKYVDKKETIDSTEEARIQLSTLSSFDREKNDMYIGNFARLKELGEEIRVAKYKTDISEWAYEQPAAITALETQQEETFDALSKKSAHKKAVLDDDLVREELREQVALWVGNHKNIFTGFSTWAAAKLEYLAVKEEVGNSIEARGKLNVLEQFCTEKSAKEAGDVASLIALGTTIRTTEHKTEYSQWTYEHPADVTGLEDQAQDLLKQLDTASVAKRAVLDDDLARELYAEETRLIAGQHVDKGLQCANWATEKTTYLQSDVVVHSIREADVALSLLDAYETEKANFTEVAVGSLKTLGKQILDRKYGTTHSTYVYENPGDIRERENDIDSHWKTLDELSSSRRSTLRDLKQREVRKEELRIEFSDRAGDLVRFCDDATSMIGTASEQKIMFGFSLKEVEAYDATITSQDDTFTTAVAEKRGECSKAVAEMAQLVEQTAQFDKAQADAHKEVDEDATADAAAGSTPAKDADESASGGDSHTPKGVRRARFNTLTKSIKKAFTKTKKKTTVQNMFKGASVPAGDDNLAWPEDKNAYTQLTVGDLSAKQAVLSESMAARRTFYGKELERWRENDAMCKEYADTVVPIQTTVKGMITELMANKGSDEDQLTSVKANLETLISEAFKLPQVKKQDMDIQQRGVSSNPYTSISSEDVTCELENVQQIAKDKKPYLEKLIEYKRYKGISPEAYELMDTLFKEYDKDGSNSISGNELRSCLFSLGEERSKKEIAGYIAKFGKNGGLTFEQFRELMTILIGDVGTQEGVIESFKLISRGVDFVVEKDLTGGAPSVPKADYDYFAAEAADQDAGKAFVPWVNAVFAR